MKKRISKRFKNRELTNKYNSMMIEFKPNLARHAQEENEEGKIKKTQIEI